MNNCYKCAHADFLTPHKAGMKGFANCKVENANYHYLPSCHVCDKKFFKPADDVVMQRRREYFKKMGEEL